MPTQTRAPLGLYALKNLYEQNPPGVIQDIAPDEHMHLGDTAHYFSVTNSALRGIKLAMLAAGKETFQNILDFGCGHGRVLRILRAAFPPAQITACDLIPEAVAYCAQTFDAVPVLSQVDPDQIQLEGNYDLIWCGTVLTNLSRKHWLGVLDLLHRLLAPKGVLVFTTQGRFVADRIRSGIFNYDLDDRELPRLLAEFERDGFAYRNYPTDFLRRQFPVEITEYGISIQTPVWVCSQLARYPDVRLLTYTERGWDNHQDIIACIREDVG
jgi:SAM-dependent methyltransferase